MKKTIFFSIVLAAAAGCTSKDIQVYRVAKEAPSPMMGKMPQGHPPLGSGASMGAMMGGSMGAVSEPAGGLRWDLPKGWAEKPGAGMRRATLKTGAGADALEASVIVLSGSAGGELANVNRWRRQVGLEAIDAARLKKESEVLKTSAGPVLFADIRGPESAILAGIRTEGGETWFFKLWGPKAGVAGVRGDFRKLLASLRGKDGE